MIYNSFITSIFLNYICWQQLEVNRIMKENLAYYYSAWSSDENFIIHQLSPIHVNREETELLTSDVVVSCAIVHAM